MSERDMNLTPREKDKLLVAMAAFEGDEENEDEGNEE